MPFVFTISKTPVAGDIVNVTLTDGAGHTKIYSYLIVAGNTLQNVSDSIKTLINADIYFTAINQTTYPSDVGLEINQVTNVHYNLFTGSVAITYIPSSINAPVTLSFDEDGNVFESFLSFHPEYMVTLGTLMMTCKDGDIWTHDSEIYNNFYGVQYDSYVTPVFNDAGIEKKTWIGVSEVANTIWDMPLAFTNVNSYAGQRQETNLVEGEFTVLEGMPTASFKRDIHSQGGKINGGFLKGNYLAVKLRKQLPTDLVYLSQINVKFIDSPLTPK